MLYWKYYRRNLIKNLFISILLLRKIKYVLGLIVLPVIASGKF